MSAPEQKGDSTQQSDVLLWLGVALVAGMGVVWLLVATPWSSPAEEAAIVHAPTPAPAPAPRPAARTDLESTLDGKALRMANLAFEAGMLIEPEEYSAWALYRRVLEQEPGHDAARAGLEKIAEELLRRADAAIEQARLDDARAIAGRILAVMPAHAGASELIARLEAIEKAAAEEAAAQLGAQNAAVRAANAAAEDAAPSRGREPDPVVAGHEAFVAALAENRLLTPAGDSAKHYVGVLSSTAPDHALTGEAHAQLFDAFLERAAKALAALDTDAARTWIDEAELLGGDVAAVAEARQRLREQLIATESARRVPASALTILQYTAPAYPVRALDRGLSGWADVEFTVGKDGETRDVVVTDASHESFFRNEAVAAVEAWRFEPRDFMGETIEQRAYTRIRFEFE